MSKMFLEDRRLSQLLADLERLGWRRTVVSAHRHREMDAQYLVLAADPNLTNERVFTVGHGLDKADAGAGAAFTVDVDESELDHSLLDGLADDDHPGHPWLAGRSGGQAWSAGIDAGDDMTLSSTVNATKGNIHLGAAATFDEVNTRLGIGIVVPEEILHLYKGGDGAKIRVDACQASGDGAILDLRRAKWLSGAAKQTTSGAILGQVRWAALDDTLAWALALAYISVSAAEDITSIARGTSMKFATTLIGTDAAVEAMRITDARTLLIGTLAKPTAMVSGISMGVTTAPTAVTTDCATIYTKDANGVAAKAWWYAMGEEDVEHQFAGIIFKTDAGDPSVQHDGSLLVNTNESKIKVHPTAAMGWREFLTVENADFRGYQAIAMVCHNGTSFPASPNPAQWFYRTDIDTLFLYEGAWKPIVSFGNTSYYVDSTLGSDAVGKGYSSGAGACATAAYAVALIPPLNGGYADVYFAAGTYSGNINLGGKMYTGAYAVRYFGTLTQLATGTCDSGVQGSGSTSGSITDTGNLSASYAGKLLKVVIDGTTEYRIIDSCDADTAVIVGGWSTAAPDSDDPWTVYDWGTILTGQWTFQPGQNTVRFYDCSFTTAAAQLNLQQRAGVTAYRCSFTGTLYALENSLLNLDTCYSANVTSGNNLFLDLLSGSSVSKTKFYSSVASVSIIRAMGSILGLTQSVIDGSDKAGGRTGVELTFNAYAGFYSTVNNIIRRTNAGITATTGAVGAITSTNTYTDNNVDEYSVAASFGYID